MSDQHLTESSNTIDGGRRSEMVVELNIKTLDSQIYSFQVDRSMLVSQFKEKIASEVGLPVGQQRLIFRGRVLKDDHALSEYHVENGHTLHLVARQSSESQPPSSGSSGEASSNNSSRGQDPNAAGLPHRIGQMSHSVVLGTLNLGDEGEGIVPDISRVIGAVLNSIGIGNQTATNVMGGSQPTVQFSSSVPVPQGTQMEGTQNNTGAQSQAGTQAQPGQALPSQSMPQVLQIPLGAAVQIPLGAAIPVPSLNVPIPDSLRTLSEYMNRMELALSQNGLQPNEPQSNDGDRPTLDLPSNVRGLPTPEALMIVLRHAQRLLSDRTVAALSHIAGRLEQEGGSTDPTVRGQIQTESMQLGLAMQHLGALLLELGRTILTLRMGQSPAESYINAGPAVYISSSGPNPIMVQPFPLQTNSLFGGSAIPANSGSLGPVGIGAVPRHVNIHIHTAVGPRGVSQADGQQGERGNRTSSGDSGQTRVRHSRNVIAAVVPSRPSVTVSSASQTGTSVSQTAIESGPIATHVTEVSTRLRNFLDNMRNENQAPSIGQSESADIHNSSSRSGAGNDEANSQLGDMADSGAGELHSSVLGDELDTEEQKASLERIQTTNNEASIVNSKDVPPASSVRCGNNLTNGEAALKSVDDSECAPMRSLGNDNAKRAAAVPLGLGLGGLQPKRKSRQPRLHDIASDSTTTNVSNQNQQTASNSQQALQSLASLMNMRNTSNITSSGHLPAAPGHMMGGGQMGGQGADGQLDVANAMSEVLHSPALSGLLTGVSQQTGVGSPDILRNMLEQFTRSPAMRNTVNQIAQQFDGQDVGNMLSGMGRGQGGGLDLAGMVQQMMPIVSQALSGGPTPSQPLSAVLPDLQPQYNERSSSRDAKASEQDSQIDLQPVVQRIEHQDPPEEIFRSVVTTAARSYDSGNDGVDLVNDLCREEGLVTEFLELLRRDLRERLHDEKGPSDVL